MTYDLAEEIKEAEKIRKFLLEGKFMNMPDSNTALLSQAETAQHIADRQKEIPDFAYNREHVRDAGVLMEHQDAIMQVMQCFQMGSQCDHEELMKACARLERSLLYTWEGNA